MAVWLAHMSWSLLWLVVTQKTFLKYFKCLQFTRLHCKGATSQGYYCLRSILWYSHYLVVSSALTCTQNGSVELWRRYQTKFHQESLTLKFCRHSIMTWKSWPNFFKFQSMSILAIYCNRWQETTANKNLLKNTAKPSWYWHLRDRAVSLLYRGVVYFTEVGCVRNLVLLSLHNGHYFFPLFQASEGKRGAREECQTHMMGKGTEKIHK